MKIVYNHVFSNAHSSEEKIFQLQQSLKSLRTYNKEIEVILNTDHSFITEHLELIKMYGVQVNQFDYIKLLHSLNIDKCLHSYAPICKWVFYNQNNYKDTLLIIDSDTYFFDDPRKLLPFNQSDIYLRESAYFTEETQQELRAFKAIHNCNKLKSFNTGVALFNRHPVDRKMFVKSITDQITNFIKRPELFPIQNSWIKEEVAFDLCSNLIQLTISYLPENIVSQGKEAFTNEGSIMHHYFSMNKEIFFNKIKKGS